MYAFLKLAKFKATLNATKDTGFVAFAGYMSFSGIDRAA